jgi:hypothetical protein
VSVNGHLKGPFKPIAGSQLLGTEFLSLSHDGPETRIIIHVLSLSRDGPETQRIHGMLTKLSLDSLIKLLLANVLKVGK